ncbi:MULTISPECIES: signal recognition particle protein [Anaerofustis]|uniref:signal recognition particle protein n=1 Tax=Anaerofustis TaxID=264995 RepID=UPI001105C24F|nr:MULTISPECIES: signal recognition particle protein [Anaerofustis]MCO8193376.1 signal recognition particle protein [Anaerofustis sp. NSJ-163]
MFQALGDKLQETFKKLRGKGKLTEKDIDAALREIRMSLLEADVNYKVVKTFAKNLKEKCMGEEVLKSLTPGQQVIKIVNNELIDLLGGESRDINFSSTPPTVIMVVGVQGSGKTTSIGKMGNYFKNKKNKKVVFVACDIHRAAAVDQLKILGEGLDIEVFSLDSKDAGKIAKKGVEYAKSKGADIVIVDTAGRQHVDSEMMEEAVKVKKVINPDETLFVIDSLMGQQAVDAAKAFDENLEITGFILSKLDSDARGGAALSVTYITNKPIKFSAFGEKMEDFEPFHPDRVASRILGMGDVLSLIEKAESVYNEEEAKKMEAKLRKNSFTLEDFLDQMESMSKMGGIESILSMLPGAGKLKNLSIDERELVRQKAIIQSMTIKERQNPSIINASRRKRIAAGSGTKVSDVNKLLTGFEQSKKMMKQLNSGKMRLPKMKFPFM